MFCFSVRLLVCKNQWPTVKKKSVVGLRFTQSTDPSLFSGAVQATDNSLCGILGGFKSIQWGFGAIWDSIGDFWVYIEPT